MSEPPEYDPDDPYEVARVELLYAVMQLDYAENAEDFYESVALLIRRSHELDSETLELLADAASYPWIREVAKRPVNQKRRQWFFFNCLCWITANRDKSGKKVLPDKSTAVGMIAKQFSMSRDAARHLYDSVATDQNMGSVKVRRPRNSEKIET